MRRKSSISLGPGAPSLILIFVVLSMAALGMLSLMTARSDLMLSERSAEVVEAVYALNSRAQERARDCAEAVHACLAGSGDEAAFRNALEAALPEGVRLEENLLCWQETGEGRTLDCALRLETEDGAPSLHWERHSLTAEIAEE